ncbi:MAG: metallophosphoesterase [Gemmataceae bacterium]|nr:metallophosphoesterase [Gemmataceae bacterium]
MQHVLEQANGGPFEPNDGVRPDEGGQKTVRIFAICDEVDKRIYSPSLEARRGKYDLLLSCGDLPAYYIDFVASTLSVPVLGIHGNHDGSLARNQNAEGRGADWGMVELHGRVVKEHGLLIGGFDGSLRYNDGSYQFTEEGMRAQVFGMIPQLLLNRARYGRYLDILITHAPPRHIHDQEDRPHQGFKIFRWFLRTFKPRYHLHGHIHIYNNTTVTRTQYYETEVLNVFPYRELVAEVPTRATASRATAARASRGTA